MDKIAAHINPKVVIDGKKFLYRPKDDMTPIEAVRLAEWLASSAMCVSLRLTQDDSFLVSQTRETFRGRRHMTTFHSFQVVLQDDIGEEDARKLMDAILQLRGVISCCGIETDCDSQMEEWRAKTILAKELSDMSRSLFYGESANLQSYKKGEPR